MEHFVIRLWAGESAADAQGTTSGLHGTARHVRSGIEQSFSNQEELLGFLRRMIAEPSAGPPVQPEVAELDATL